MLVEVNRSKNKIDNLISKIDILSKESDDLELISHMTKYLCVLISGYFEKAIFSIITNYTEDKSHPYISSYFYNDLKNFTNAKTDKITSLLNKFDSEWESKFIEMRNYDETKAAINSIIGQRHLIAHGNDSNIGYVTLKGYYKEINKAIKFLEEDIFELNPA